MVRVILCAACGVKWVGRSGWPTRALSPSRPERGSVGRSIRPKICFAALRAAGRSVGLYVYSNSILRKASSRLRYDTCALPQCAEFGRTAPLVPCRVGRSGGPTRSAATQQPGVGSVGRSIRPNFCFAALRAAGRSVGGGESETHFFLKLGRSVRTQSAESTSHRLMCIDQI